MPIQILIKNIKYLRKEHELSMDALAKSIGIKNHQLIQQWESGKIEPQTHHLALLSYLFDISINDLCRKDIIGK